MRNYLLMATIICAGSTSGAPKKLINLKSLVKDTVKLSREIKRKKSVLYSKCRKELPFRDCVKFYKIHLGKKLAEKWQVLLIERDVFNTIYYVRKKYVRKDLKKYCVVDVELKLDPNFVFRPPRYKIHTAKYLRTRCRKL